MEMKIGRTIQSTYCKEKNNRKIEINDNLGNAKNTNSSTKVDTFSLSPAALLGKSISAGSNSYTNSAASRSTNADISNKSSSESEQNIAMDVWGQTAWLRQGIADGTVMRLEPLNIHGYEENAKFLFDIIKYSEKCLNEALSKRLEEAGVPKDVTFEFDFSFDSSTMNLASCTIEVTEISDEKYRENVEKVLADSKKGPFTVISYASRVMNGYISSLYYPWISKALDRCFGQDINELYIDENGNLGGVNKNLQAAINAEKKAKVNGEHFFMLREFDFPAENIEELLKRLVSDENITPNISHMGYDGECIYTNDGEFKFGKEFDPNWVDEEKYVMRGTSAFLMSFGSHIDLWLENYEKFY